MSDYKFRMLDEHSQLVDRMNKLKAFLWQPIFNGLSEDARGDLIKQLAYMEGYERTPAERISKA